jgi:hypothetical protein
MSVAISAPLKCPERVRDAPQNHKRREYPSSCQELPPYASDRELEADQKMRGTTRTSVNKPRPKSKAHIEIWTERTDVILLPPPHRCTLPPIISQNRPTEVNISSKTG